MRELDNKPNQGVLFVQKGAEGTNRPNWKGGINIPGVGEVVLAGWERVSAKGVRYVSLKVDERQSENGENGDAF